MCDRLRIFVADDEPAIRNLVELLLRQLGHQVTTADGGRPLVELCRSETPDLVICDLGMPDLDGIGAAALILREAAVPVILMSGNWEHDYCARADALGVHRLDKPFTPLGLIAAVAAARPHPRPCSLHARPAELDRAGGIAPAPWDALFRRQVETAEDHAIVTLDPAGRVIHWNRGAEKAFGYPGEEMLGRSWEAIFSPSDRESGVPGRELTTAALVGKHREERWHARKDGSAFWGVGVLTALRADDGSLLGYGQIVSDQTDLKERELALEARAAALQQAERRRTAFLAVLAHELRNPLAPLQNYARILRMVTSDEAVHDIAGKIDRQTGRIVRLVEDMMDASRMSQGKTRLNRQRVDLRTVVGQGVEMTAPRFQAAGHELAVDMPGEPVWVDADPERMCQVVVNLMTNAAKYTPPGGRVSVAVEPVDGHATLRVRDSGVGIPAGRLGSVFELFSQDDRTLAHAQGGLGIGLALVRELTALHAGTVEVASDGENLGSEFKVRLPVCHDRDG